MKSSLLLFIALFLLIRCYSQTESRDSTLSIDTVLVRSFEQQKRPAYSPISVSTVSPLLSSFSSKTSLVNGLNAIAGVRMEERSPGSYRLNIRGSSLRSPFGVRNVKVYWNEIPLTDPGGNTYFNQLAWNNFSHAEIVKGPAGSMYGAGTGGLVWLSHFTEYWRPGLSLEYIAGSYGLHNIFLSARFGQKENKNQLTYAHNQADGYRVHTNMRRDNFSWITQLKKPKHELTASFLFTDMYYQTPGALTLGEYQTNPRAARPPGGGFPGAVSAGAAIYQKNMLSGISNLFRIAPGLKNTTTLYGAWAQIKNPAIRNYEKRTEPSVGGRSVVSYDKNIGKLRTNFIAGTEMQWGYFTTRVSKNRNGQPDSLQTDDEINNRAQTVFVQAGAETKNSWHFIAGISLNRMAVRIKRLNSLPVTTKSRSYRSEPAPKFSLMKNVDGRIHWLASVSRGFSPPTIPELLPSTGIISTELEAENGWNYETTVRSFFFRGKLKLELTAFYFRLKDALVQRRDLSGADFFVNAGDAKQQGLEFHADYYRQFPVSFFRKINLRADLTLNRFRYGSFIKGSDDFSGNHLPSVPGSVFTALADTEIEGGFLISVSYYGASPIFLNDANTARADPYHLLGCQLGWKKRQKGPVRVHIYAGADNLLDEIYSLGNDINATANRFYNAAPGISYFAGIALQWISQAKN